MSLKPYREDFDGSSPEHSSILSAIAALKSDKAALKSALKSALVKKDEIEQRLAMYEESTHCQVAKRREIERENQMLRRDNGDLAQRAEDYRRELQKSTKLRDNDLRLIRELHERIRSLEEEIPSSKPARLSISQDEADESIEADLQKYAQFMLEKLEESSESLTLFKGRVGALRTFWTNIQTRRSHNSRSSSPAASKRSMGCQTLNDQSTNTGSSKKFEKAFSFAPIQSEPGLKSRSFADVPAYMFSTSSTEGMLSPTSTKSVAFSLRADDEYSKIMDESQHLLSSLHVQSDRLLRLNSQIQQTMERSRKTPLHSESSQSYYSRPDSMSPFRVPYIGIPSSPQSLQPVEEREKREEISVEGKEPLSYADSKSKSPTPESKIPTPESKPSTRKSSASLSKPRTTYKSAATTKLPYYKTDVSEM